MKTFNSFFEQSLDEVLRILHYQRGEIPDDLTDDAGAEIERLVFGAIRRIEKSIEMANDPASQREGLKEEA